MNEAFSLMLLLLGAVLRKEFVIVAIEQLLLVERTLWEPRRAGSCVVDTCSLDNSYNRLSLCLEQALLRAGSYRFLNLNYRTASLHGQTIDRIDEFLFVT
jgi:hypothetical protein